METKHPSMLDLLLETHITKSMNLGNRVTGIVGSMEYIVELRLWLSDKYSIFLLMKNMLRDINNDTGRTAL